MISCTVPIWNIFLCEDLEMLPTISIMCKQMLCYVAYAFVLHVERVPGMQVGLDDVPTRFQITSFRDTTS
jgi:hypothetical protein